MFWISFSIPFSRPFKMFFFWTDPLCKSFSGLQHTPRRVQYLFVWMCVAKRFQKADDIKMIGRVIIFRVMIIAFGYRNAVLQTGSDNVFRLYLLYRRNCNCFYHHLIVLSKINSRPAHAAAGIQQLKTGSQIHLCRLITKKCVYITGSEGLYYLAVNFQEIFGLCVVKTCNIFFGTPVAGLSSLCVKEAF